MGYSLRQKLGAAVIDWPRFEIGLRGSWTRIRNRRERLRESPDGRGVACDWRWTSDLHVAKVFPSLGRRLMVRATDDWPISLAESPPEGDDDVQVSFVIGHRGMERVPQLQATLASIAAQRGVCCECVVVEQSARSEVRDLLPRWVRYVHTPPPWPTMPYCRSWAFNAGAHGARGNLLVFHDGDLLVPERYAAELWNRCQEGYEVVNLKRFIFYLSEAPSRKIVPARRLSLAQPPEVVMQNAEAGGSIALTRNAFYAIGGYDESFVGWGGEDNEFWDRAQTRRVWPYGYLPFVHLWHAPQTAKLHGTRVPAEHFRRRSELPPEARIAELTARDFGNPEEIDPPWIPAERGSRDSAGRPRDAH